MNNFFFRKPYALRSWTLVGVQMACLLYIFSTAPVRCIRIELQIWQLSGLFLALSGLIQLSWTSFSIFPEPKPKGLFVQSGIYAFIRHPMYAGLLVLCSTLVIQFFSWQRLFFLLILLVVFVLKILTEEKLLVEKYPEYADYQRKTNRIIPFVW